MMGFASDKTVADEKLIVPRRVTMGNFKLCGVLLAYAPDAMVAPTKAAIGANFAPVSHGAWIQRQIVELVQAGTLSPLIGSVVEFDELPAALERHGQPRNRRTGHRQALGLRLPEGATPRQAPSPHGSSAADGNCAAGRDRVRYTAGLVNGT